METGLKKCNYFKGLRANASEDTVVSCATYRSMNALKDHAKMEARAPTEWLATTARVLLERLEKSECCWWSFLFAPS